jgi:hypothetical protein
MPGASSSFIFRTAKSSPHITRLRGGFTRWLSSFDSADIDCENGFIYLDSQVRLGRTDVYLHLLKLDTRTTYGLVNCLHRLSLTTHGHYAKFHSKNKLISWLIRPLLKLMSSAPVAQQTSSYQKPMICIPSGVVKVRFILDCFSSYTNAKFRAIILPQDP